MIKRKLITLPQAEVCTTAYQQIPIRFLAVSLKHALAWSSKHRIYAYDAYILECARQSNSSLLTLDGAVKNIGESSGITVLEV